MTAFLDQIRAYLLSPDSPFELFLRTVYHKVLATKWYFHWQNYQSKRSYRKFRAQQLQGTETAPEASPHQPKVTFLLSCADVHSPGLETTLRSIQALQGDRWEVILFSLTDQLDPEFKGFKDQRIFVAQTEQANPIELITGEYVIFCQAGDQFYATLLVEFFRVLSKDEYVDLVYYDCDYLDQNTGRFHPLFKPSTCSPALLLSVNYLSRGFIKTTTLRELPAEVTNHTNLTCLEYAICATLCEKRSSLLHIPKVLATQTRLVTPDSPETQQVIVDHLSRQGLTSPRAAKTDTGIRFTWGNKSPSLAIIIPSKNNARFLQTLIPALVDQPYQGEKSIYIVDNGSDDPATTRYYHEIEGHPKVNIIPYPQPFNYSEAINLGVRESASELVLLMNDDMALMDETWLDELAQWAIRPDIGVVGPKLLRKNHTIQHAGIIMGLTRFIGHIYLNAPEDYHGLFGSADWYRNYLAATGACQMVRREVFNEVEGYDEGFQLAFGDIDFCLRVHESGYHNVYAPFARLYHFEGSSRGYKTPVEDALNGYDTFESYLINEDPYFSPNLTYTRIPKCVLNPRTTEERRKQIQARKRFYLKKA